MMAVDKSRSIVIRTTVTQTRTRLNHVGVHSFKANEI